MYRRKQSSLRVSCVGHKLFQRRPQSWTIEMIQKIISMQDNEGQKYVNKNTIEQVLLKIDRSHIEIIDRFSKYRDSGFNLLEFVRFFLNIMDHQQIQNLYLTIGLIDLFKSVSTFASEEKVTFSHLTNYFCQKILEKQYSKNQIQAKYIPQISFVNPTYQIKDFIRNPPTIYASNDETLYKLSQNSILTDKSKHLRAVSSSCISYDLKVVFTHDALSQHIAVYDFSCNLINKVYPSFSKIKKDVVVLGFAFSPRQCRLGAVLKNFAIILWDCTKTNNFDYQKTWTTISYCQHLQTSIYHLDHFNSWMTADKTGKIYFWDLLNSRPQRQLKCRFYSSINYMCQIAALNILAVVQESKQESPDKMDPYMGRSQHSHSLKKNNFYECNIILYNFFTGQVLNEISCPDDRVPHTIQYSQQYQMLFSAGLQKKIKLWEINPVFMDSSPKGQLIGHENLVTCFTLIKKTSLLVSCDDKGKIKLWDFKNFACTQTIDFSDKAMITNLLDMVQIGKVGFLGSRIHYLEFEDKAQVIKKVKDKQKLTIEWVDHDQFRNEIYLFTQKDLRVIDMERGCVKYIYGCFSGSDDDYTCFRYFSCISKFAIGNDKGEISIYDISTGAYLCQLKTQHQGSIIGIQYDQLNKLYISIGSDSSILIHREASKQLVRQIKGNFKGKEIQCFQLSVYHNLIAISTLQKQFSRSVFIWNYEFGKLSGQVIIKEGCEVASLQFINCFNILAIATNNGNVYLVKIKQLAGPQIRIEELSSLQLNKAITSLNCDVVLKGGKKTQLQECVFIVSFQDGSFQQVNITSYIRNFQQLPHIKRKANYNPYRQSRQTFLSEYMKQKHFIIELGTTNQLVPEKSGGLSSSELRSKGKLQIQVVIDQQSDVQSGNQDSEVNESINCVVQEQTDKDKVNLQEQSHSKPLGLPIKLTPQIQPLQSGFSELNALKILNYQKRFILMVGNHKRVKIYTHQYKLICDLNINYPLPYKWLFKPQVHKKIQDKIYFAIKVLSSILNKYQTDISVGQAKNFRLKELFDKIGGRSSFIKTPKHQSIPYLNSSASLMLTQPIINFNANLQKQHKQQKIPLIQQEYTKNDLNYNLIKQYNFHQIAGPTLKQLDHIKKIQLLQKQWRQRQHKQQQGCQNLLKMIETRVRKNQQKEQVSSFLSPSAKIKDQKEVSYVSGIRKKLDNLRNSNQKEESKQKQKLINLFNGSKLMNFTSSLITNKKQATKQNEDKDKTLLQACMKKYRSVKSLKRLNTAQTFQEHYLSRKQSCQPKIFEMNRVHTTSQSLRNGQTLKNSESDKNCMNLTITNFRDTRQENFTAEFSKVQSNPITKGSKLRRILTQMNEKIKQKKKFKVKNYSKLTLN